MAKGNRKNHRTAFKAKVALEAINTSSRFFLVFDIWFPNLFWGGKSWVG